MQSSLTLGTCEDPNYTWTDYINIDSPIDDGDFETLSSIPMGSVCQNPIAIQVYFFKSIMLIYENRSSKMKLFWCQEIVFRKFLI